MGYWWCLANFDYDTEAGVVSRRSDGFTGSLLSKGYPGFRVVGAEGQEIVAYAHQIAWVLLGRPPLCDGETIDHEDRKPLNNRPGNLRAATKGQQNANKVVSEHKLSGLPKGVSYHRGVGKYASHIGEDKRRKHLGYFDCPAAASFKYQIAADKAFGEFSTPGFRQ
jgi:hypothetical protein